MLCRVRRGNDTNMVEAMQKDFAKGIAYLSENVQFYVKVVLRPRLEPSHVPRGLATKNGIDIVFTAMCRAAIGDLPIVWYHAIALTVIISHSTTARHKARVSDP